MLYTVKRQHLGDRMYIPGDEREANEREVAHLVAGGILEAKGEPPAKAKAEAPVENKAAVAPKNKAG